MLFTIGLFDKLKFLTASREGARDDERAVSQVSRAALTVGLVI